MASKSTNLSEHPEYISKLKERFNGKDGGEMQPERDQDEPVPNGFAEEADEKEKDSPPRVKQSTILEGLSKDIEFFHTRDLSFYAALRVNGHREIWPIGSSSFKHFLV